MTHLDKDEIKSRIRLAQVVEQDLGAPVRRYSDWWMYFCPFHENTRTPALGVNLRTDTFKCFSGVCGVHGDIFTWHMLRHDTDFKTALAYYRQELPHIAAGSPASPPVARPDRPAWEEPPSDAWQVQALTFLQRSQVTLWSPAGGPGMAELQRRGISPDTARRWGLGYSPRWQRSAGKAWGLAYGEIVWLPRGLVIPCFHGPDLWYLKVRIFGADGRPVRKSRKGSKYLQIRGSRPALFGTEHFHGHTRLLLAESELDAILAWQEAGDLLDVASLGGAGRHLSPRWMLDLLPYRRIVLAYDRDRAGRQGAQQLQALSQRLVVVTPPAADLCAYRQQGGDLRGWLEELA